MATQPWVLVLWHLSVTAFGRQPDWSRLCTLLTLGNSFLLGSNPPLLVEKGRELVLDGPLLEIHHCRYLDAPGPRTDPGALCAQQQAVPRLQGDPP